MGSTLSLHINDMNNTIRRSLCGIAVGMDQIIVRFRMEFLYLNHNPMKLEKLVKCFT